MIDFNERRKHLTCGCCGDYFMTWLGYRDQDQDAGYGICRECQIDDCHRDHDMLTDIINQVAGALNETNRAKYLEMDREMQEVIVYKMMDKGILKWQIGGRS